MIWPPPVEALRGARSCGSSRSPSEHREPLAADLRRAPRSGPGWTGVSPIDRAAFDAWFDERLAALRGRRGVVLGDAPRDAPRVRPSRDRLLLLPGDPPAARRARDRLDLAASLRLAHRRQPRGEAADARLRLRELGCMRVEFKTDARNERSRTALAGIGARFEGIFRNHMHVPGAGRRDSAYFSIIDDEWPAVRAALETGIAAGGTPSHHPRPTQEATALMPRRDDINKILLVGSGPIVIGQAAEFDYSGTQACKVLREEGYEVVLVNSNPATIMTDPEFSDATYIEPLLPEVVTRIIEKERPDALLPTLGGQTALNLAKALHDDGTLEKYDVELIGADYDAIHRAEDREAFRDDDGRGRPADAAVADHQLALRGRGRARARRDEAAGDHPARLHDGRPGRRRRPRHVGAAPDRLRGPRREPDQPDPARGVGARLGRVRARADARQERQRRRHLLDREHRPDGRPHRRLGHRRAGADAHGRALPGAPRPGDQGDPRGRRRDRRLQRPVRRRPGLRARSSSSR